MDLKYVTPKENRGLPSSLPSPSSVRRNVDKIAGARTHILHFDKENVCCGWQQHGNAGVGWHSLLQGIFLTQESNPHLLCLLRWQAGSLPLGLPGKPFGEEFSSVQPIHSVMSTSLQPHGLQHSRLPCPSPTPRAYSNSCPSGR